MFRVRWLVNNKASKNNWKYINKSIVSIVKSGHCVLLRSSQRHPAAALLWFHAGSSPGCQCSSPRCRGRAAWLNRPRCTHHPRRNSSASTASWTGRSGVEDNQHTEIRGRDRHVLWWHTCWPDPVVSALAQVHRLVHRSLFPCRRTLWWSCLLCLWGSNCTGTGGQRLSE